MEAKVRSEHRWRNVTAFGGIEFVKSEYRPVPAGLEKEAQAHPFLEIKTSVTVTNNLVNDVQVEEPVTAEPVKVLTAEEKKAAWAAKMVKARADKKAKGG